MNMDFISVVLYYNGSEKKCIKRSFGVMHYDEKDLTSKFKFFNLNQVKE